MSSLLTLKGRLRTYSVRLTSGGRRARGREARLAVMAWDCEEGCAAATGTRVGTRGNLFERAR
jgi:hypothetical protein